MKLLKYRVTNYRSVVDSGWVEADRVTALIGVNESGKTNLLLPLWKLNPAREGELKATSDYPKATFNDIQADPGEYAFVEAEFDAPELMARISQLSGISESDARIVRVTRYFDGNYSIRFPNHAPQRTLQGKELAAALDSAADQLEKISPLAKEGDLKSQFAESIQKVSGGVDSVSAYSAAAVRELANRLRSTLPENPAATSSIVPRFRALLDDLEDIAKRLELRDPEEAEGVFDLVTDALPKFVYYSNYGNLDSEIYLPHVVQNMQRTDLGAREAAKARTLRVLFSFVKLQPDQILELGRDIQPNESATPDRIAEITENKRTRTIMLNSAGTDLTKKFKQWWKQGDYTFEFQADGDHFRIWVSDSRRPEKVELEDRSAGLQWFLSFYLVFLVESAQGHENAILLLDEPGLSLHPLAQRDLSAFFENLAVTNQLGLVDKA